MKVRVRVRVRVRVKVKVRASVRVRVRIRRCIGSLGLLDCLVRVRVSKEILTCPIP